ncbi:MAG: hypothetical protein ACFFB2_15585 [Promethearchaeota archaeon]
MIKIRRLETIDEFKKTFEIQRSAWGVNDLEIDPHFLMISSQKYGGLLQGFFFDNECVGFTYGIIGKHKEEYFFFSYMTAVMKEFQGRGFGFLLKKAQREEVLKMGYNVIRWFFDPLESLNAFFNIHRLGIISKGYESNIYGEGGEGLHKGLPTDRLIATWNLKSERVIQRIDKKIPKLIKNVPEEMIGNINHKITYIEIPKDIQSLKREDLNQAYHWRIKTREMFKSAFKRGFVVEELIFSEDQSRIFYKLKKAC